MLINDTSFARIPIHITFVFQLKNMKNFIPLLFLIVSVNSFAQKKQANSLAPGLILNKGQQIVITTSSSMDAEMM